MNLDWLNPLKWIKKGVVAGIDAKVDQTLTAKNLEKAGTDAINRLIQLSNSRVEDSKIKLISNDLIYAGESLIDLGKAIDPDGEKGRYLSEEEIKALHARVKFLFGDLILDWDIEKLREWIKSQTRKAINLEG